MYNALLQFAAMATNKQQKSLIGLWVSLKFLTLILLFGETWKKYSKGVFAKIPTGPFVAAGSVVEETIFSPSHLSFLVDRRVLLVSWLYSPLLQPFQHIVSVSLPMPSATVTII